VDRDDAYWQAPMNAASAGDTCSDQPATGRVPCADSALGSDREVRDLHGQVGRRVAPRASGGGPGGGDRVEDVEPAGDRAERRVGRRELAVLVDEKNWLPLVLAPALAIARVPRGYVAPSRFSSSKV
jgi:hypothetical protein